MIMKIFYTAFFLLFLNELCYSLETCPEKCECISSRYLVNCSRVGFTYIDMPVISDTTKVLDLRYNHIKYLRLNNLRRLRDLRLLYLDFNRLESIGHNAFHDLLNLQDLSLFNNDIKQLNGNHFSTLKELKNLKLGNNKLRTLTPNLFVNLHKLESLYLQNNQLTTLKPRTFKGLESLINLHLYKNRISYIHVDVFQDTPNLKKLFLQHNLIKHIIPRTFDNLYHLEHLYLNHNHLTAITNYAFEGLRNLQRLFLNSNHISQLEPKVFRSMPHIKYIGLYRNKIQNIPLGLFSNTKALSVLLLEENPIQCSCKLADFINFVKKMEAVRVTGGCRASDAVLKQFRKVTDNDVACVSPKIMEKPQDMVVDAGSEAKFRCAAMGEPQPEVVWLRYGRDINQLENTKYEVMSDSSLMVHNAGHDDVGMYECLAKNSLGEDRSAANLSMKASEIAPTLTIFPKNQAVNIGKPFLRFDCAAEGNPKPHITWYYNDENILRSERISILHNGSLIIKNVKATDTGFYSCKAKNLLGEVEYAAELTVMMPPEFTSVPTDQTIKVGHKLSFNCTAAGHPSPNINWYKNSEKLINDNHLIISDNGKVLIISEISLEDAGEYMCEAINPVGAVEITTKVTVVPDSMVRPPKIVVKPENTDAFKGTRVQLPCEIESDYPTAVEWRKDGSFIDESESISISAVGNLIINNVSFSDSGVYECATFNEYGEDISSAILNVKDYLLEGDEYVNFAINMAAKDIDTAIQNTLESMFNNASTEINVHDLFRITRFPNAPARDIARAAEIYERTLEIIRNYLKSTHNFTTADPYNYHNFLSNQHLEIISRLSGCTAHREEKNCSDVCFHSKYRSFDGTCNNYAHPTWGASLTVFRRILMPIYENGFSQPVGWNKSMIYNGFPLPSARKVSTEMITTKEITADESITHMVMQWGQWLDHDIDHSLPSVSSQTWDGVDCKKTCDYAPPCFPIDVPANDTRVHNRRCIDFIRTSSVCGSGMTSPLFGKLQQREQINQLTSYIDASQVYGFDKDVANDLRDISTENGLMRVGITLPGWKPLLPTTGLNAMDCRLNLAESTRPCFVSGDIRANEQIGLAAMHTIWMREHNRLARQLKDLNPAWDGDKVYHESRKILGAQMQHITYQHWLPIVLGPEGYENLGHYEGYKTNVDSSISNVFATAALRFGHTLINPVLNRYDENFETIPQGPLLLRHAFFSPWRLVDEGGVDPLMRGMFATAAKLKTPTQNLNSELTEQLFYSAHAVALDLAAINIQRGRDHAIPPYTKWRQFCNMTEVNNFDDLVHDISDKGVREKLKELYGSVHNIDVWVGGILEDTVLEGKVGPLIRCLLLEQFKRLRDGDRFWYEGPSVFKAQQLNEIKKTSLARVLCDNGDKIDTISNNVFLMQNVPDDFVSCKEIPSMDLTAWLDCDSGCHIENGQNLQCSNSERIDHLEETVRNLQQTIKELSGKNDYLQKTCIRDNKKWYN